VEFTLLRSVAQPWNALADTAVSVPVFSQRRKSKSLTQWFTRLTTVQRSRLFTKAKEQVTHSMVYAFNDRKDKKGDFRQLWIQRINAAARENGMTYNRFIQGLKAAGVEVDRRVLSDIATNDPATFKTLVDLARKNLVSA